MDSLDNEQLFDAITMANHHGYSNAARYVFYDALSLARKEIIEDCIDLAIKKSAYYLMWDLEKMRKIHSPTD